MTDESLAAAVRAFAIRHMPNMDRRLREPLIGEGQWSWVKYPGLYAMYQELGALYRMACEDERNP